MLTCYTVHPKKVSGDATHWALVVGDKRMEVGAWSYKTPFYEVKQIKNYLAFYPEVIEELIKI